MKFAVIGGDKRMLFAAKAFFDSGSDVSVAGFDSLVSLCGIRAEDLEAAALGADAVVLPVRPAVGGCLYAPFSAREIGLGLLSELIGDKPVFSGSAKLLFPYMRGRVYDYSAREDFAYRNAELTAEGALSIILGDYEDSVFASKVLVLGYGRIGKLLSRYLTALGADVTVAARKLSDRSLIGLNGMRAVSFDGIDYKGYDIIINTVPAPVVDRSAVEKMNGNVYIIDLASSPGGVDFKAARERDVTCVHALSLPGKTAPQAAGRIIKDTIYSMIKEENGGKDNFGLRDDGLLLHLG